MKIVKPEFVCIKREPSDYILATSDSHKKKEKTNFRTCSTSSNRRYLWYDNVQVCFRHILKKELFEHGSSPISFNSSSILSQTSVFVIDDGKFVLLLSGILSPKSFEIVPATPCFCQFCLLTGLIPHILQFQFHSPIHISSCHR